LEKIHAEERDPPLMSTPSMHGVGSSLSPLSTHRAT
jgi:hypothetical protein